MTLPIDPNAEIQEEQIEIGQEALLEDQRLQSYIPLFERTHPRPEKPELPREPEQFPFPRAEYGFFKMKGVEAVVNWIATVCGIIFSAIRTAGIFGIAELRLLTEYQIDPTFRNSLSIAAGAALVGVIEGVLAGFGYRQGKKSGKTETSYTPAIIAGAIAALAGLIPSFGLLGASAIKTQVENGLTWILVLLSGPGIAYLIYVVTENIGYLHNEWIAEVDELEDEWNEKYNTSHELWETTCANLKETYDIQNANWHQQLENDYRQKGRAVVYDAGRFTVKRTSGTNGNGHKPKKERKINDGVKAQVDAFLKAQNPPISPHDVGAKGIITPKEIAVQLNILDENGEPDSDGVRVALVRLRKSTL